MTQDRLVKLIQLQKEGFERVDFGRDVYMVKMINELEYRFKRTKPNEFVWDGAHPIPLYRGGNGKTNLTRFLEGQS